MKEKLSLAAKYVIGLLFIIPLGWLTIKMTNPPANIIIFLFINIFPTMYYKMVIEQKRSLALINSYLLLIFLTIPYTLLMIKLIGSQSMSIYITIFLGFILCEFYYVKVINKQLN